MNRPLPSAPRPSLCLLLCLLLPAALACAGVAPAARTPAGTASRLSPPPPRPLLLELNGRWIGNGVAYGPHRDGQHPEGASPTRAQLGEDLALISRRWSLLRTYNASPTAEAILEVIRAGALTIRVMLGCWIAPEEPPEQPAQAGAPPRPLPAAARNRAEVEGVIRLANAFPDVVASVIVGNETQISWSDHRVAPEVLIRWLREVRARTTAPVTTADDFGFWATEESLAVAGEVDYLDVHAYAMWAGQPLEQALAFTEEKLAAVAARHPGRPLVLGEFGWATRRHTEGEQAKLIKGVPGEAEQAAFFRQAIAWTSKHRIANLWFEVFDENWKGGSHPDEVEKHWGLYRADRTPKQAVQEAASRSATAP